MEQEIVESVLENERGVVGVFFKIVHTIALCVTLLFSAATQAAGRVHRYLSFCMRRWVSDYFVSNTQ